MRNAYKIVVGKPEVKRLVGGDHGRWEDNAEWFFERNGVCECGLHASGS
jgi:hypothetical protein